jgi:DNA-binding NarL/FixJ family response regulator
MSDERQISAEGLLLSDDWLFTSRIVGTARDLGFDMRPLRTADALLLVAAKQNPRCIIVDLSNPTLTITDLIQQLRACCDPMPRIVAYGSHVDAATLHAARGAGCDLVLPRSKFVEELPKTLSDWMKGPA